MIEKNSKKYPVDEEIEDTFTAAASSGDMTGLIPSGLTDSGEIDAYSELYPYLADETSCKGVHNTHKNRII